MNHETEVPEYDHSLAVGLAILHSERAPEDDDTGPILTEFGEGDHGQS